MTLLSMSLRSYNYIPCFQDLIFNMKGYKWKLYDDIIRHIFGLLSSTLVSDLYGLIRRILYLIYFGPHCKFTTPLVKNRVITNGPLYSV